MPLVRRCANVTVLLFGMRWAGSGNPGLVAQTFLREYLFDPKGDDLACGSILPFVELSSVVRGLQIDLAGADAVPSRFGYEPCCWVDGARGADCDEQVGCEESIIDRIHLQRHLAEP